jgi:hypothetical protein
MLIGWARGGRAGALDQVSLRGGWVLASATGLALLARLPWSASVGPALQGCACAGALLVLWQNRRHPWIPAILAGLAMNGLVMWLNGGRMPLSGAALNTAAHGTGVPLWPPLDARYVVAGPGTRLTALGDTLPIRIPGYAGVVSPGDLLMSAGMAGFVQSHMCAGRAGPRGVPAA